MKAKLITMVVLIALFTIIVIQNTHIVPVNFYFWKFEMSAIILIAFPGLIGVILGYVLAMMFEHSGKKEKKTG